MCGAAERRLVKNDPKLVAAARELRDRPDVMPAGRSRMRKRAPA
jgi:hypothetical protein